MNYETNPDGTFKLDENGNPIPKISSPPEQSSTNQDQGNQPPTNKPAALPPEYFDVLGAKDRELAELKKQLQERSNTPTPAAQGDPNKLYYDDPNTFFTQKINDAVSQQIAPLNSFVAQQRKDSVIDGALMQLKFNPAYAHFIGQPTFIAAVRQALANSTNVDVNMVAGVVNAVVGYVVTGQLQGVTLPNQAPSNSPAPTMPNNQPPYIQPNAPSVPQNNNNPTPRMLTEEERRLARVSGLSDVEYLANLEGSSRRFVNTKPTK